MDKIRDSHEYQAAQDQVNLQGQFIEQERSRLLQEGYSAEMVERGLHPVQGFRMQLVEEIERYKREHPLAECE